MQYMFIFLLMTMAVALSLRLHVHALTLLAKVAGHPLIPESMIASDLVSNFTTPVSDIGGVAIAAV